MSNDAGTDFSVVIVTYNSHRYIEPCLRSICQELAGRSYQVIVIDNASTDLTLMCVDRFLDEEQDIKKHFNVILHRTNVGFTKALNVGLKLCRGEYIIILNPDTEVLPGCLKQLYERLNKLVHQGVIAPQLLYANGTIQASCRRFPRRRDVLFELSGLSRLFPASALFNSWKMGDFGHTTASEVDQPQGAFLMFHRPVLEKVGPWDETFSMFFSDVDWCRRVRNAGYPIFFEPAARAIHHQGASVKLVKPAMIKMSHRSFYDYFMKHRRRPVIGTWLIGGLLCVTAWLRIAGFQVQKILKHEST